MKDRESGSGIIAFPNAGSREDSGMDYTAFYNTYYDRIVRFLAARCSSYQDAEDLASEAFLYCLNHWNDYDATKAARSTWLYMIVQSRWKNYCLRHKSYQPLEEMEELLPDTTELERSVQVQELRDKLAEALEQLPDNQKRAIIFRFFADCSDEEIARRIGVSQGNVRVLIHRGLRKLEKECAGLQAYIQMDG